MLFPIWQPLYASSHQLAAECGKLLGQKSTHTGTLDPLAEGVLVILTDEDKFVKGCLSDWDKVYSFSIIWGFSTDSGDKLGIIQSISEQTPNLEKILIALTQFPTEYLQQAHPFSAYRWQGKSAYDFAKNNHSIQLKKRKVTISDLKILNSDYLTVLEILRDQKHAVTQVSGDFRQAEICANWDECFHSSALLSSAENKLRFLVTRHTATVSTGTYIRQLVQDLAQVVGIPATTWGITRTHNGPFAQPDCLVLGELAELTAAQI